MAIRDQPRPTHRLEVGCTAQQIPNGFLEAWGIWQSGAMDGNAQIIVQALAGNSLGTQSFLEARDVNMSVEKPLQSCRATSV